MHMIARGLRENRVFLVTSILILFILLIAFLAPHIAPYDPLSASMKDANLAPSSSHIFGTDKLGRDVFSRILCGAERSLSSVLFLVALILSSARQPVSFPLMQAASSISSSCVSLT